MTSVRLRDAGDLDAGLRLQANALGIGGLNDDERRKHDRQDDKQSTEHADFLSDGL